MEEVVRSTIGHTGHPGALADRVGYANHLNDASQLLHIATIMLIDYFLKLTNQEVRQCGESVRLLNMVNEGSQGTSKDDEGSLGILSRDMPSQELCEKGHCGRM